MDASQITALAAAVGVVITSVTALISAIHNARTLDIIHTNTNSTLTHLQTAADVATSEKATAAELAARPARPTGPYGG